MSTTEHQSDLDPFMCTCGPCKKFWKDNFNDASELLRESSLSRAQNTAPLSCKSSVVKVGDRVEVYGKYPATDLCKIYAESEVCQKFLGTVKFVGVIDDNAIAPNLYVGVKLDDNVNSVHNGLYKGKRYFHCTPGHGAMVKYTEVKPLKNPSKTPPVKNNYMFPSWDEVKQRRKLRNEKLAEIYAKAGVSPTPSMLSDTSSKRPKSEPVINVGDPNDIAIKDQERKRRAELHKQKVHEEDHEKNELRRLRQQFGSGQEGDRMAQTLLKLQRAYQEGLQLTNRRGTHFDISHGDDDY
ncbi:dynactin subunit 1-like isoform X2 [Ostrea edulis]|uniref:dynactin subunit 1-like isoform X2 n=1 Tax=Ostrea edulis TaxID=37623 RepID=UPI00209480C8|nr:dynactin subunit 1-like isoform X2 [Ostrea edulis]